MANKFQILALSGGGFLGLYTATVLAELEASIGRPIAESFDLIAGTSVGGIIALGLAAQVPARDIKIAFENNGKRIFSNRQVPNSMLGTLRDIARFAFEPKYTGTALRETIQQIVGVEKKIGELQHRVIVPAVNVTKGEVQLFKTPHHPDFSRDLKLKLTDVALATSAAPTYFPLAEVGDWLFADGGLYANSPDILALHEAEHFLGASLDQIHVLSIGTTTARYSFAHQDGNALGAYHWLSNQRLTSVMLAAQQQSVHFMMKHRLGQRYIRLDHDQSKAQARHLALDVATVAAQRTIRGLAMSTVQNAIGDEAIKALLGHKALPPKFFNIDRNT